MAMIKEGRYGAPSSVYLGCVSELGFFGPEVAKSFYGYTENDIASGILSDYSSANIQTWDRIFKSLNGFENMYPIYLFHDSDDSTWRLRDYYRRVSNEDVRLISLMEAPS